MRDLIAGFIADPWLVGLDLDTREKVPTNFVDRRFRQRTTDVVWRVRTSDRALRRHRKLPAAIPVVVYNGLKP